MSYRERRRKARNRKILIAVLSTCTIIVWALVVYAFINAPNDTRQANNFALASQPTNVSQVSTLPLNTTDKPTGVASFAELMAPSDSPQPTNTLIDTPIMLRTATSIPLSTSSPKEKATKTPIRSPIPTSLQATFTPTPFPTAIPTPTPTSTPIVLSIGAEGDEVTKLQQQLVYLGYLSETPDGIFGESTKAAVKDFQKTNGLTVDGIAGTVTIREMFKASAMPKPVTTAKPKKQTEINGSTSYVWVTKTGSKYHRISNCGNSQTSRRVTLQDAKDMGLAPCKNCY